MKRWSIAVGIWLVLASNTPAALVVKVASPKTTGSKTLIELELKNTFTNNIESVRAVIFLMDDQGKMAAQAAQLDHRRHKRQARPRARPQDNLRLCCDY